MTRYDKFLFGLVGTGLLVLSFVAGAQFEDRTLHARVEVAKQEALANVEDVIQRRASNLANDWIFVLANEQVSNQKPAKAYAPGDIITVEEGPYQGVGRVYVTTQGPPTPKRVQLRTLPSREQDRGATVDPRSTQVQYNGSPNSVFGGDSNFTRGVVGACVNVKDYVIDATTAGSCSGLVRRVLVDGHQVWPDPKPTLVFDGRRFYSCTDRGCRAVPEPLDVDWVLSQ